MFPWALASQVQVHPTPPLLGRASAASPTSIKAQVAGSGTAGQRHRVHIPGEAGELELRGFEPMAIAGAARSGAGSPLGGICSRAQGRTQRRTCLRLAASRYRGRRKGPCGSLADRNAWLQAADIARRLSRGDNFMRMSDATPPDPQTSATCSTSLPKFSPAKSLRSVSGKVAKPTTISSRDLSLPAAIQPAMALVAS
jgi:hypothetical protein